MTQTIKTDSLFRKTEEKRIEMEKKGRYNNQSEGRESIIKYSSPLPDTLDEERDEKDEANSLENTRQREIRALEAAIKTY